MADGTIRQGELVIDLDAVVANRRRLQAELGPAELAAAVKADAYGLGMAEVATALWRDGCRRFFVANVAEGVALRAALPDAWIAVLEGPGPGLADDLAAHDLVAVVNSLDQVERWSAEARRIGRALPTVVHADTGMARLGLPPGEIDVLVAEPGRTDGLQVDFVMSHLASADVAGSTQPAAQLGAFTDVRRRLADAPASLANSAGVFLGREFHLDLVRTGIALYGGSPVPTGPNPMVGCVTLHVPLLQVRPAEPGDTVGYGATHVVERRGRIGTIGVGYADGFLRSGSGRATVSVAGHPAPVVGRVSMDLVTVDLTDVPEAVLALGGPVEIIGPNQPVDAVAARAGTISYEILTSLGPRHRRRWVSSVGEM